MRPPYRLIVRLAFAAFVAFEISRAAAIGAFLIPVWQGYAESVMAWTRGPLWIAAVTITISALAFVIPMAVFIYGLLALKRRLSRKWTLLRRQG